MKTPVLEGIVTGVFRSETKGSLESTAYPALEFAHEGVVGDKHFGHTMKSDGRQLGLYLRGTLIRNNRQWSAVSEEELRQIADKMGVDALRPEWLGANLLVRGIPDFTQLPPLSLLVIRPDEKDKVVLVNHGLNLPCVGPHRKIVEKLGFEPETGFVKAAMGRRGLVGWVEKAGLIHTGDPVRVLLPA
jgi:hypothetical protein